MRWLILAAVAWLILFALGLPFAAEGNSTVYAPGLCPSQQPCNSPGFVDVHWRMAFLFAAFLASVTTALVVGYTALVRRYRAESEARWLPGGAWLLLFVIAYWNVPLFVPLNQLFPPAPGEMSNRMLPAALLAAAVATILVVTGLIVHRSLAVSRRFATGLDRS